MNEDYLSLGLLVALAIGGMIGLNYILTPHANPASLTSGAAGSAQQIQQQEFQQLQQSAGGTGQYGIWPG